ncbi:hypothetical protein CBS101457_002906 [Exobasidium rhododendri]|nr:hypothetical protein CBS101457_002906 [Exobasidium rhododendri]
MRMSDDDHQIERDALARKIEILQSVSQIRERAERDEERVNSIFKNVKARNRRESLRPPVLLGGFDGAYSGEGASGSGKEITGEEGASQDWKKAAKIERGKGMKKVQE